MKRLSFAIIGGGPAGFYIGKCLTKLPQQPLIHMFEKEYCPFGLIRYGVAPDHISIKKSQTTLSSIANYPGFKYHGNQAINQNLLNELKNSYSGVIYAYGAQGNNQPNWFRTSKNQAKNSSNLLNARNVVYWYNNHPQYESYSLNLSQTENVVIIGNGNVAIDIARIFLKKPEQLINTQISINALQSLRESKIRNVTLIGRRGFTHSAFALKELRQISHFNISVYCIEEELQKSMNQSSYIQCTSLGDHNAVVVRMNKRKIDFIKQKCHIIKKEELPFVMQKKQPKIILRYLLDPIQISKENQLKCVKTQLKGEPFKQTVIRTEKQEHIQFDMLINSTGFKVSSIQPSQLDEVGNRVINSNGCVLQVNDTNKVKIGTYSVGWCKNGPRGVIDETLLSSQQTFNNIRIHVKNKVISAKQIPSFCSNNQINFQKYLKLKEIQLERGDKEKFIKKKMNSKQTHQFFSK